MEKFLFLTWFYSGLYFTKLVKRMLKEGEPCLALRKLYKKHFFEIQKLRADLLKSKIQTITYVSPLYPENLKCIEFPPWVLSVYGNIDLLNSEKRIGIVGSRKPDQSSLKWISEELAKIDKSVVVISGGAIGIDQKVHQEACQKGVSNICVLPVGIFKVYPLSLKKQLRGYLGTGKFLLVSPFHPTVSVSRSLFHPRNYVLAGLSHKVLIVQAEKKSGTMVTAKYALEQGRDIYALPASPWNMSCSGNLELLEDGAYQIIELSLIHL